MRSLLITRNYPPLVGGMERVCLEVSRALAERGPSSLVGPEGAAEFKPQATFFHPVPAKPLPKFLLLAGLRSILAARKARPQVVVAGSGLTAPMAWFAAQLVSARSAVYLHGLDVIAPSRVYQSLWLPFIRRCDVVLCNSEHTRALAVSRGVPADRIAILNPGTNLPGPVDPSHASDFRHANALGDRPLMVSVGRFTRRKGLVEFVGKALPSVVASVPEALLLIVGDEASDALHGASGGVKEEILSAARTAGVLDNLRFMGRVSEHELESVYAAASCHVFPVLDVPGDVEGFGMVALEAAAHGLPTVAFRVGGVPDAVRDGVTGKLIDPGDYASFANRATAYLRSPLAEGGREAARDFARQKEWAQFRVSLMAHLQQGGRV